jgi:hypothetical protein
MSESGLRLRQLADSEVRRVEYASKLFKERASSR